MKLTGSLRKFDFAELLQMLAIAGKSGKLTITQQGGQAMTVLREGKIIYAASSSARETLGHMLLCRGLVTEEQLKQALSEQRAAKQELRLGTVFVSMGLLSPETLEKLLQEQVQSVIAELVEWTGGHFQFEEMDLPDCGEVGLEAREFLLDQGLPPDQVLLESFARLQETAREADESTPRGGSEPSALEPSAHSTHAAPIQRRRSLRKIMTELRTPAFTGEIALQILGYAGQLVQRGALFSLSPRGYRGLGQFGFRPPGDGQRGFVRAIALPLGNEIVFAEAIERKSVFVGPMPVNDSNQLLVDSLGGGWPREVLVAPVVVGGRVLMIFFGEDLLESEDRGGLEELELVLLHAGLAVEKDLLEKRIKHYETLRRDS